MNNNHGRSALLFFAFFLAITLLWLAGGEITAQTTRPIQPAGGASTIPVDPSQMQRMMALQQQIIQYNAILDYLEYRLNLANAAVDYRAGMPPVASPAANPSNSGKPLAGRDQTRNSRNSDSKGPLNFGTNVPRIKSITRNANGEMIIEYDNQVINTTPNASR